MTFNPVLQSAEMVWVLILSLCGVEDRVWCGGVMEPELWTHTSESEFWLCAGWWSDLGQFT